MRNYQYVPVELRQYKQWLVSDIQQGMVKKPTDKAPRNRELKIVDNKDSSNWMSFEEACSIAISKNMDIGFVLTKSDPFCVIDLDIKNQINCNDPTKFTAQDQINEIVSIVNSAKSYVERSSSGQGFHLIAIGEVPNGINRGYYEIYSDQRYITVTGDVVINCRIEPLPDLINSLYYKYDVKSKKRNKIELVEYNETRCDYDILHNIVKSKLTVYEKLYLGTFDHSKYRSQSEADMALLSYFCGQTDSNEQVRRLFRSSALGKREKATKDNRYLNETISVIRYSQAEHAEKMKHAVSFVDKLIENLPQSSNSEINEPESLDRFATIGNKDDPFIIQKVDLPYPPGFLGELARFIYSFSIRPVKEISIVSALAFVAGIFGKSYSISNSGLNLYINLVAKSAVGKEAIHESISLLSVACQVRDPVNEKFSVFDNPQSGQALQKMLAEHPSFVNVFGEWGKTLAKMADGKNPALEGIRTVMTNIYHKSNPSSRVGGMIYSNSDKNVRNASGVAYSMIGESTPEQFYQALAGSMMEDGFLSRFLIVDYTGIRPPTNRNRILNVPGELGDKLANLCKASVSNMIRHVQQEVNISSDAQSFFEQFDVFCDSKVNSAPDEATRQAWSRALLKILKVSALLSIVDDVSNPLVRLEHVEWARILVSNDIATFVQRLSDGEIGASDHTRSLRFLKLLREYCKDSALKSNRHKLMQKDKIISRDIIQYRLAKETAFSSYQKGLNLAISITIQMCVDNGYIVEVPKSIGLSKYATTAKCYQILPTVFI